MPDLRASDFSKKEHSLVEGRSIGKVQEIEQPPSRTPAFEIDASVPRTKVKNGAARRTHSDLNARAVARKLQRESFAALKRTSFLAIYEYVQRSKATHVPTVPIQANLHGA